MKLQEALKNGYPSLYAQLRHWYLKSGLFVMRLFAVSRLTASLYFCLLDSSFRREHYGVLQGIIRYRKQNNSAVLLFHLRRNIHRLEKGLSMKPRRNVFALDFIEETIEVFSRYSSIAPQKKCEATISWASEVLEAYFCSVDANPIINRAERAFSVVRRDTKSLELVPKPYSKLNDGVASVNAAAFRSLSKNRRSVRWFLDKPVPRAIMDSAVEVAIESPTACNRQPYFYYIFDDVDLISRISRLPLGTRGFAENIPCLVAVTGNLAAYSGAHDRHGIYIDVGLSVMGFLYAIESNGLASCVLNWADIERRERMMEQILGLEPFERVVVLIAVGYPDPDGLVPYSEKSSIDKIRGYNLASTAGDGVTQ